MTHNSCDHAERGDTTMMDRRTFLKLGIAGGAAFYVTEIHGRQRIFALPAPGVAIDPGTIPKYQTPLLLPPAMPRAGKVKVKAGKNIDYYEIVMRQFSQQILPAGLPATTVWGYGPNPATVQ